MLADLERRLAKFGVSGDGRSWLIRALHPAGDAVSPGLPDESGVCVLRPEYRVQYVIPPISSGTYDLYIWTPPGDVNGVYWAAGPSPCDFGASTMPAGAALGTINLQAFVDSGVIWSGLEFVSGVPAAGYITTRRANNFPIGFRHQYKSITCHLIATAVSDQGDVYAAQYPNKPVAGGIQNSGTTGSGGYANSAYYSTVPLPANETQMTAMSPECYMAPARDGAYLPLRLTGPVQEFVTTKPVDTIVALSPTTVFLPYTGQTAGIPSVLQTTQFDGASSLTYSPWVNNVGYNVPTIFPGFDTGLDNMNIGVVIFRGLTGASGGGFGASVMVKCVAGLEIIPSPTSPDRVFCQPAAPYDPRALEAYYAVCLELKDAYPASYNALGSIMSVIGSVASKIWPYLAPSIHKIASDVKAFAEPEMESARRVASIKPKETTRLIYKPADSTRQKSKLKPAKKSR